MICGHCKGAIKRDQFREYVHIESNRYGCPDGQNVAEAKEFMSVQTIEGAQPESGGIPARAQNRAHNWNVPVRVRTRNFRAGQRVSTHTTSWRVSRQATPTRKGTP